jgi:hypothetical protein
MDNDSPMTAVPDDQALVVARGSSLLLQLDLMGKSHEPLGYIETFAASSGDEAVVTVESFIYSRGYRARLDGVNPGDTSFVVTTPALERSFQVHVE